MVFVDTALGDAGTIQGIPHRDPPPVPRFVIRGLSFVLGQFGMMRFLASDTGPPPASWTAAEWDVLTRLKRQRKLLLADAKVGPEQATAQQVREAGGLENMPLVVLTQGRPIQDQHSVEARVRGGWVELQRRFAERSRFGRQILVQESGHGIPIEAPQAIVNAVRDLVITAPPSLTVER